jgi:hypothetical protein
MGKLLAGMLLALVIGFVAAPNASAAEIPPTAECVKTSKKLFRQYFEKVNKDDSETATKKADRELAQGLFDADCISAVEPLLKPMKPKPFSKKCVAAAKAADNYWKPANARYTAIAREFERRLGPLNRRINRLDRRIRKLRQRGAPARRIRAAAKVRRIVTKRRNRINKAEFKKIFRFLGKETYPTLLTLYELFSLRCLDTESDFFFEDEQKGPAARVVYRNGELIFGAVIYLSFKYFDAQSAGGPDAGSASSASASSLEAPPLEPQDEPRLPLVG